MEKLLKSWIVLDDGEPPRSHELDLLAREANLNLANLLLDLQPFAVEARYQIGDFKLPPIGREVLRSSVSGQGPRCHLNASQD